MHMKGGSSGCEGGEETRLEGTGARVSRAVNSVEGLLSDLVVMSLSIPMGNKLS